MSNGSYCTDCGKFIHGQFHQCDPEWQARFDDGRGDWFTVRASDATGAAEKFCQAHDKNGDYDVVSSGEANVEVMSHDGTVTKVFVEAWNEPVYRATIT